MLSYYYVMAQLPTISASGKPPFSFDKFLDLLENSMPSKDFELLKTVSLEPPIDVGKTGSKFLDEWYKYEKGLRFALANVRAGRLNWAVPKEYLNRPEISEALNAVQIAREACALQDPLEAETFLDKARFSAAQQINGTHHLDKESLFAYAIMLLLRLRAMKFDSDTGRQEYNNIYDKILES